MAQIRRTALVGSLALLAALVAALIASGPAAAFSRQDVTLASADGTTLAATLFLPDGAAPPSGWPGVIFMHGLAGDRSSMNQLAQSMGVIGEQYAVLTFDARGHGASGGLVAIDGPNEIADTKAAFQWFAGRPQVSDTKIGAWGISYGGGAAWNSLAAGVPWTTIEVCETWTNLATALIPQGLGKSGVIAGFLGSLDPARLDPSTLAVRDAVFSGTLAGVASFAAARSSIQSLKGARTPVFMMQGRRDFAFGLDQALTAYHALAGPKRLWIGNHGHAPSSFPAADSAKMLAEGKRWFDRYLRGIPGGFDDAKPVIVAASGTARVARLAAIPKTLIVSSSLGGSRAIAASGKWQRRTPKTATVLEVFGSPLVRVEATAAGGWSRLVAVLSATTPGGKEIVVSGGGVPTIAGRRSYLIRMTDQATFIPKGSKLTLTLASSSLAQSPGNLLYLDLPMSSGARVTIGTTRLTVPVLAHPVSR